MEDFYIEVEDKRTGRKLVLDSAMIHGQKSGITDFSGSPDSISIDNSGGYMTNCPELSNKTIPKRSHTNHGIVYIFRKSIEEWLRLADKITLQLKHAGIDQKTYFSFISTFWTITEIAMHDILMKDMFSGYSVKIIEKLHQLKDYQAQSKISEKADVETMRGSVIRLMAN